MPFCANCGAEVKGSFCDKCGTPVGGGATPPPPGPGTPPPSSGMQDNVVGLLCYLGGVITGIIFLVLEPYNRNKAIRFHAFQSIFVSVGYIVLWIVLMIVTAVLSMISGLFGMLVSLLGLVLWLGGLGLWIYLMVATYQGKKVVLPVVGPMAEKQA